eukprot:Nitzschia sp. Nitz4//NODE_590_length_10398_cov_65.316349//4897//6201//NITZ4_additional_000085-RA//1//CDS//3329531986//2163//frame0
MSKQLLILALLAIATNNVNVYAGTSLRRRLPVVARDWSNGNGDEEVIRAHHRIDRLTIDKMEAKALEAEDDSEWTDIWYSRVMVFTSMPDPGDETSAPTPSLTATPVPTPGDSTTSAPTMPTTSAPTPVPSPTTEPSDAPSVAPSTTSAPVAPSASPSFSPTPSPSEPPSPSPTAGDEPTAFPTGFPSEFPTAATPAPSRAPTSRPSASPTTGQPTGTPTFFPTGPTFFPTSFPTDGPTPAPTASPSSVPTVSQAPSSSPTFVSTLSYNAVTGTCAGNVNGLGCAGPTSGGNPNDLVNCFTASDFGVTTPFVLDSVRFWVGNTPVVPADLAIKVWTDVVGGAPGDTPALTESITGYSFGENEFALTTPMTITTDEVCVGLFSGDTSSGFRLRNEEVGGSNSFILAPTCDIDTMSSTSDLGFEVAFCLEALVHAN